MSLRPFGDPDNDTGLYVFNFGIEVIPPSYDFESSCDSGVQSEEDGRWVV